MTTLAVSYDTVGWFSDLALVMNGSPERFTPLGDADTTFGVVMHDGTRTFAVQVSFEATRCAGVASSAPNAPCDFSLDGPLEAWSAMFDDILANGRATGLHTINSLVLLGDDIRLRGDDPMGLDKFSRFNQTIQEFFDGAARTSSASPHSNARD